MSVIFIVIERKSVKDLCSSIVDGRMSEQRNRLIESIQDTNKIIYIIKVIGYDISFISKLSHMYTASASIY